MIRRLFLSSGIILATMILGEMIFPGSTGAVRVKDIAQVGGVRYNQLVGYGLVVGLSGTGDREGTEFTVQSLVSMLRRMGITVDPEEVKVKNVAAVIVTANLPPFVKPGSRIDVLVSSLGDARSLQGGTLLFTPLRGADGEVYAIAQGPLSIGGFSFGGAGGGGIQKNHPTVGQIPAGAIVEKTVPDQFSDQKKLTIFLRSPDFTTVQRMTRVINRYFNTEIARAKDSGTILVQAPNNFPGGIVELAATIERLEINPDTPAKVVIDERTGTVVMGENVRISTIAISHGNLTIMIKEQPRVSQPLPFSGGTTQVIPESDVTAEEGKQKLILVPAGVSIKEVVKAINAIGATPRDLIAILQAIKAAGALQAELEIM
jgi:flagellar P-ring protein precursor FlgI